jgi:6-phosphogluconolactonase
MKSKNFGQVFLVCVVSLAVVIGLTSCAQDYTTGFLYVFGSKTNQIAGYRIANDTGNLHPVAGSPYNINLVNPMRSLLVGGHFLYVVNKGDDSGNGAGISLFSQGGDGVLSFQLTYPTQGYQPVDIVVDSGGSHLFVLDTYSSNATSNAPSAATPCEDSNGVYHAAGDITAFSIIGSTGRLQLITNQQQQQNGVNLNYFPVGCFPIRERAASSYIFTVDTGAPSNSFHANDVQTVFPYSISGNGQLLLTQNAPLATGAKQLTGIGGSSSYIYLLDGGFNQILPYTVGTGNLQSVTGGAVDNDPSKTPAAANPNNAIVDASNKFVYVTNGGGSVSEYTILTGTAAGELTPLAGSPVAVGSQPSCIVEDPSKQFVYITNFGDDTITGQLISSNQGTLGPLRGTTTYSTVGGPTWCITTSVP